MVFGGIRPSVSIVSDRWDPIDAIRFKIHLFETLRECPRNECFVIRWNALRKYQRDSNCRATREALNAIKQDLDFAV